ncbi:Peroxidase [Musa troglodytarum]|nr:Peroxidase [Musa troglodytarum]
MHFHDCFVRGCDASLLLDSTPGNTAEKDAPPNNPSMRGFEVIDAAKAAVEASCPSTVSCADIIAFAARTRPTWPAASTILCPPEGATGGCHWTRRLSPRSLPNLTAAGLRDSFAKKGLSVDEMVTLSGAHSIGRAHCTAFARRLYNFNATHPQDPSMDPAFAAYLKSRCSPATVDFTSKDPTTLPLDAVTPGRLDNQYYKNLAKRRAAVLGSDAAGEPADGEAGAPGREAGVGLGGQVRGGHGEDGPHRGAHGKPGGDQEDVWGGEPSPVAPLLFIICLHKCHRIMLLVLFPIENKSMHDFVVSV